MFETSEYDELLDAYLKRYRIDVALHDRMRLLKHLDLVVEKNKAVNLTRIVEPRQAIIRHVVDSLVMVPLIDSLLERDTLRFLDIGTGAGFPGIPLGIVMDVKGTLVDSVKKKAAAVKEFLPSLGLDDKLEVLGERIEDVARNRRAAYNLVVARAVADTGVLVEYASPLLSQGGYLIVLKGMLKEDELQRGKRVATLTGMKYVSRETLELPDDEGHRELLLFKREGKSKVGLPRKTGFALHKPLA